MTIEETDSLYSVVIDGGKIDILIITDLSYLQAIQARKVLRHAVDKPLFVKPNRCVRSLLTREEEMVVGYSVKLGT